MPQCYNVPASLVDSFKDQNLIIRSRLSSELVEALSKVNPDRVWYLELTSLDDDPDIFSQLDRPMRLNLVVEEASPQFSSLYKFYGGGLERHPIRVTVMASPGFGKVVKLAGSLGFGVKIETTQPSVDLVREIMVILDYYLHNPTVSQPIEFFHSMLISFCNGVPITLWEFQEEDPSIVHYITDNGKAVLSRRLQTIKIPGTGSNYLDDLKQELLREGCECKACPFFSRCLGYFKVPDRQFGCHEIKMLLGAIGEAASSLASDYERMRQLEGA
jgi:hypothetical protein